MKRTIAALAALTVFSACAPKPQKITIERPPIQNGAVGTLQRINANAYECWAKDAAFKAYAIIPELDTTGTPRILLVTKGKAQGLPKLVVTASGRSVQTFGPLAQSPLGPRINADVTRWAKGAQSCSGQG